MNFADSFISLCKINSKHTRNKSSTVQHLTLSSLLSVTLTATHALFSSFHQWYFRKSSHESRPFFSPLPAYITHGLTASPKSSEEEKSRDRSSEMRTAVVVIAAMLSFVMVATMAETRETADVNWVPSFSSCNGTVGDCLFSSGEEEFSVESEVHRRILAASWYISYSALKRGTTPCSVKGLSYYNCRPGARANPYHRSCSAIARCRRY